MVLGFILPSLVATGCGGGRASTIADRPAPPAAAFPTADGRWLQEVLRRAADKSVVVLPSGQVFQRGRNRFAFGVFTRSKSQVPDAEIALYVAPSGGGPAAGPFPARIENLQTSPAFRSQTVASDPDSADNVYVTSVPFAHDGKWDVGALSATGTACVPRCYPPSASAGSRTSRPWASGRLDPHPTISSVGGEISKIDTRTPHDDMHDVDLSGVLGEEPVVLLFATPALCQSRVCGPVVDQELEAKSRFGDQVAFIHMEVYNENNPSKGIRPQLEAYGLPTEPWLFVIDRNGVVRTRIEGAFGIGELESAIDGVAGREGRPECGELREEVGDGRHTQVTRGGRRFSGMFICVRRRSTHTASVALMAPTPPPRLLPAPWRPVWTASRPTSA